MYEVRYVRLLAFIITVHPVLGATFPIFIVRFEGNCVPAIVNVAKLSQSRFYGRSIISRSEHKSLPLLSSSSSFNESFASVYEGP